MKAVKRKTNEACAPLEDMAQLVFLNGVWRPELSRFGSVPSCILMGDFESGYELTLGEQTCLISQPIELLFKSDRHAPKEIAMKFAYHIGKSGRLTLLENFEECAAPVHMESDIRLQENAKFVHGKIASGRHTASHEVFVATGAYYSNFCLLSGATAALHEMRAHLQGEEAQTALSGLMLLNGKEEAKTRTCVEHQAPHCASRQVYKSVLNGKSRAAFEGKIVVAPQAQKSDGYQLSRALLLSDQAVMDVRPELEINADDVKCSHGSTIGDLDEDALFYLRARGLSETQARALLIDAFVGELIDGIQIEEWRDIFRRAAGKGRA